MRKHSVSKILPCLCTTAALIAPALFISSPISAEAEEAPAHDDWSLTCDYDCCWAKVVTDADGRAQTVYTTGQRRSFLLSGKACVTGSCKQPCEKSGSGWFSNRCVCPDGDCAKEGIQGIPEQGYADEEDKILIRHFEDEAGIE